MASVGKKVSVPHPLLLHPGPQRQQQHCSSAAAATIIDCQCKFMRGQLGRHRCSVFPASDEKRSLHASDKSYLATPDNGGAALVAVSSKSFS